MYGDLADDSLRDPSCPIGRIHTQKYPFGLSGLDTFYTTWDDHDYGVNDAGGDFAFRSRAEDLGFLDADTEDPRRTENLPRLVR